MPRQADGWPVAFSAEVKALVVARHQLIAGAGGPPICPCCGQPIRWDIHWHHRKNQRKGGWAGDGRPSNALPVHGRLEGAQCHFTRIEEDVSAARDAGWILLMSAPPEAYQTPVRLNYREAGSTVLRSRWVVLDDSGGWRELGGGHGP